MPYEIPLGVARRVELKAYQAADHLTAAPGRTLQVVISKNGAGFVNPSVGPTTAIEISHGWYYIDLLEADIDTVGPLIVRATEATVDDVEARYYVAPFVYQTFDIDEEAWTGMMSLLRDMAVKSFHRAPDPARLRR
jgi:hypothetical protein